MARRPAPAVVAIVFGSDFMQAQLVDRAGSVHFDELAPLPSGVADLDAIEEIRNLAGRALRGAERLEVAGGCVVLPGSVDSALGIARYDPQFRWHNLELGALLTAELGFPVVLEQNVRAVARAEGSAGGGACGVANWLAVSIGTRIDAAAVVEGRVQRGATGTAGEFGHLAVYPFGDVCGCGQRGCVQAYASSVAIVERYARISGETLDLAAIAARVGREPLADEVWGQAIAALGLALIHYTMIADPELIVLGGDFASSPVIAGTTLPLLRAQLRSGLVWRQSPRLQIAELGADAALLGAQLLAWERAGSAA